MAAVAASAVAQRQFEELGKRGLPANRDYTLSTVLGDVDRDGDVDVVVGNIYQQNRLYLNNGTGTFTDATASRMPVGSYYTTSLALGDVDRDGDLDLVLGNYGQSRLYLNNGTGTFTDATTSRMPVGSHSTTSLALGDVDRDGDLDLIVGLGGVPTPVSRLFLNDGTGTFTHAPASRLPVGNYDTRSLALGDVDGDGDLDLVVGNGRSSAQQSRLFLNDGTGTFTDATASRMPAGSYYTTSLALGDVDGDADLDLVVGNGGGFAGAQQSRLYLNDGTGTFTDATASRMPVGSYDTRSLALGDVDKDGDVDLVLGNNEQSRLYLNSGTATFTDGTASRMPVGIYYTTSLALGDVDGDADLDLVLGNGGFPESQSRLYLNNGTGTFTDATAPRMPVGRYNTTSLALGDVDGDADLDLVVGNSGQQSILYLNNGTGTFMDETASRMPVGNYNTNSLALGDVDGDADLDLVVGNTGPYGGQSRLYLNNGTGTFTDATAPRMPVGSYNTTSLALGDVDGDSDLDLVVGNGHHNAQQSRLYLNNGTGTFTDATASRMPVGSYDTSSLTLGDVDGDGDLDLVVGNFYQQSRLYLNNGAGTFTDATASRMPIGNHLTRSLALGDVDGDGDLDLVLGNGSYYVPQQSRLYLNNGTGTFADATAARMPVGFYHTNSLALGDVDRDGDLDLVVGNGGYSWEQSRLYLNHGTGTFTDATGSRMPVGYYYTTSLALGDADLDGDLDLALGNSYQQVRLYQNLLRQLDAPYVLHIGRNYQLDVYSRYGPATTSETAFPFLSTGTANIPFPPFGTIGIDLTKSVALPPFVIPQPAGIGSLTIPVPNLPALAGVTIYAQAVLDQQPVQVRLTNVNGDVILR